MPSDVKVVVKRVTDYGPKPRSAVQALVQAHAFLSEEGQWIQNEWFADGDPAEAYEKSACGSWRACAMGALGLVTGESPVSVVREYDEYNLKDEYDSLKTQGETDLSFDKWVKSLPREDFDTHALTDYEFQVNDCYDDLTTPLSYRAAQLLSATLVQQGEATTYDMKEYPVATVFTFNDRARSGRTEVLDLFADTIRRKGGTPLVDHRQMAKDAEAKRKRSAAAKKAAKTRKLNKLAQG